MAAPFFAAIGRMFASVAARAVGTRVAGGAAAKSAATRAMSGGAAKRATAGVASRAGGAAGRGGGKGGGTVASAAAPPPGPGPRSGGGAGGSGAGSTPPSGGRSPGDWRPVVDAVAKVGNAMNPFRLGSQIGRSVSDTIRNAVQGIAERRDSGAPMSAMQRILSGFVQQGKGQPQSADHMPGLSADQINERMAMGQSSAQIEAANDRAQEKQYKEAMEQRAAEEAEKLKESLKGLTKGVIGANVAMTTIPMVVKRMNQSIIESRRGDARFSGQAAGAFARYDLSRFHIEQASAKNTAGSTKAAIESQIELEQKLAPMMEDLKSIGNSLVTIGNNVAGWIHDMNYINRQGIKAVSVALEKIVGNTQKDKKDEDLLPFNTFKKIVGAPGWEDPGKVKPLDPIG